MTMKGSARLAGCGLAAGEVCSRVATRRGGVRWRVREPSATCEAAVGWRDVRAETSAHFDARRVGSEDESEKRWVRGRGERGRTVRRAMPGRQGGARKPRLAMAALGREGGEGVTSNARTRSARRHDGRCPEKQVSLRRGARCRRALRKGAQRMHRGGNLGAHAFCPVPWSCQCSEP